METQYFYTDGNNQFGPFTIDELKEKKITKETSVWFEGIENWTKAGEVPELEVLFKAVPPPLPSAPKPPPIISKTEETIPVVEKKTIPKVEKKKKSKVWLLIGIIGGFLIIASTITIVLTYKNSQSNNHENTESSDNSESNSNSNTYSEPPREKTPEELRQELYAKEQKKPKEYLSVSYTLDRTIFSGKDVINGTIFNSATMATFKDVVLKVTYSTGTGTELSTDEFVVYKYVYPNSSTSFQIKTVSPSSTKKIGVKVSSASAE
jgi:cytoskeletal protein RodZ